MIPHNIQFLRWDEEEESDNKRKGEKGIKVLCGMVYGMVDWMCSHYCFGSSKKRRRRMHSLFDNKSTRKYKSKMISFPGMDVEEG